MYVCASFAGHDTVALTLGEGELDEEVDEEVDEEEDTSVEVDTAVDVE